MTQFGAESVMTLCSAAMGMTELYHSVGRVGLDLAEKEFYVNSDEHCSI
jgi:hypothetical protein